MIRLDALLVELFGIDAPVELAKDVRRLHDIFAAIPGLHVVRPLLQALLYFLIALVFHTFPMLGEVDRDTNQPTELHRIRVFVPSIAAKLIAESEMCVRQVPQVVLLEVPLDVVFNLLTLAAFVLLILGIVRRLLLLGQLLHD